MSERAAFISAILDNPTDDTARLVFADWLDEHGEAPRAEFIRVQIEAATLPDGKRAKSKPQKRAEALLKKHEKTWREAVGLAHSGGHYVRGFLTNIEFISREFVARAEAVLALEPITLHLRLHNSLDDEGNEVTPKWVTKFAANPALRAVNRIELNCGGFGNHFGRLMKSPYFPHLSRIDCFEDVIGVAGVKGLAESPSAFTLDHLDLNSGLAWDGDGEETKDVVSAVKVLATHPRFASLRELGLPFNSLGKKCVELLLNSKTLAQGLKLALGDDNAFNRNDYKDRLAARFTMVDYL